MYKKKSQIVNIIIWINILVYVLMVIKAKSLDSSSVLIEFGAKNNSLIKEGQYYRLISAMFLHITLIHLVINNYSLYVLGDLIVSIYGVAKFTFIYLISGIMGNIFSYSFNPSISAGASGAIFGLLGSLVNFGKICPTKCDDNFKKWVYLTIIINILYGLIVGGVDNFAHIGGLIGGYVISRIVGVYQWKS